MYWFKCDEEMPNDDEDQALNNKINCFVHPGFIVCYHHGDDHPFLARCFFRNGKFVIDQDCNSFEDCPDQYQRKYWLGDPDPIIITHWARLYWPEELKD